MGTDSLIVDVDSLTGETIPAMQLVKTEIDTAHTNMKAAVQSLVNDGYMDSETATAYVEEFETLLSPDIQALSTLVESYYTQLGNVCTNFVNGDIELSRLMG
ncbi:MAG: hypothetical protein IJZ96_11435 [Lachnospiraceae bacterium]|nr:hypothetical protein [Lachnospiraceae bacterium]